MLLHILILLLVTMSAAQGNGQQDNSSQSKQLPKKHLRFVTGNWIEEMENEVKNSTEKMLKVLNQISHMKDQMTQIMLTTEKLEKQLLAESHTLQMLKGHSSELDPQVLVVEFQQQTQLAGMKNLKLKLKQILDLQSSTLTSIQDSLQAASISSSNRQKYQAQLLEIQQQLRQQVEQDPDE